MRYLKLTLLFLNRSLQYLLEYKVNFFIWSLVSLGWTVIALFFFEILYGHIDTLAGWTKPMMYVFQGTYFLINFIIWGLLWENIQQLPLKINRGELDLLLTKPINTQFIVSFQRIDASNITDFILGLGAIAYGFYSLGHAPGLLEVVLFLLLLFIAATFFYAAWFSTVCLAFWTDRLENVGYLFPGFRQIWRFPRSVYSGAPYFIFSYLIPITLAATVPPQVILGIIQPWPILLLLFFSGFALYFSHLFYQVSLKHYSSASS